jgi:flagellar biosynthesis protein FlhG
MADVIAIASGKGGVGKTWLSITLAHALARLGQRVLLFDGDLGLANIDIQLGLEPGPDLGTVLSGRASLLQAIRSFGRGGFDLICGRSGSGRLAEVAPTRIKTVFETLDEVGRAYDFVLLDLAAGVDLAVRVGLKRASTRLIVATDEPTALTDAYALIKVSAHDGAEGRLLIAINVAAGPAAGRQTFEGLARVCVRFLGHRPELGGVLRRDPRVPDAIRHQTPLLLRHPTSPAGRDVEALARNLNGSR